MPPSLGGRARDTMISPPSLAVRTAGLSMFMPPRTLPGGRDAVAQYLQIPYHCK